MSPRLSVVLPTRNRVDHLQRAAASVLGQGFADIELVVVDDASDDGTPDAIDRLAEDRRVRVVRTERASGPGGARNRGIAAAQGGYLGFCDDDDEWLPGAAAMLVDRLDDRPDLGLVTSWHRVVHERTARAVDYRGPLDFGAPELLWFNFVALPFAVVRREFFPELRVDDDLPTCEDWDLWLRCAEVAPVETFPQVLYSYRQHAGSRVTSAGADHRRGREGFLAKHASSMSPACRLYHRAVIAGQAGGRAAMIGALGSAGRASPAPAARASAMLTATSVASTVGRRRGDPGLPARALCDLLRRRRGRRGRWPAGARR